MIALVWVVANFASQKTLWIESIDVSAVASSKACIQLALKNVGGGSLEETGIDGIFEPPITQDMRGFSVQSSIVKDEGIIRISVAAKQGKIDEERKIFLQSRLKVFAQAVKDECSK